MMRRSQSLSANRAFTFILICLLMISLGAESILAQSGNGNSVEITDEIFYVVQGESEYIEGVEADNQFYVLRIITMKIPINETKVYFNVPQDSQSLSIWTRLRILNQSGYGWVASGEREGQLYVNVPSESERITSVNSSLDDVLEMSAPGSSAIRLSYSPGGIHLSGNNTTGVYVSPILNFGEILKIQSASLLLSGDQLGNVTSQISIDNGTTWQNVSTGTEAQFSNEGTSLRVRLNFDANRSQGYDPIVFNMTVEAAVISPYFILHMSYSFEPQQIDGKFRLDFAELNVFSSSGSLLLMLFLTEGYTPYATGINFSSGASSTIPNKILFQYASSRSGPLDIEIEISSPPFDLSWVYLLGAVIFILASLIFFMKRPRTEKKTTKEAAVSSGSRIKDELPSRRELIDEKKKMLDEIEKLNERLSKGEIGREEHDSQLSKIKKQLKDIKRELNRVPKTEQMEDGASLSEGKSSISDDYKSILTLIAKLDEDYEAGRLPDETHQKLRKSYMTKAAQLKASLSEEEPSERDRLQKKKESLMNAISKLDDDFNDGAIEKKVYDDLRSSYRNELIEIMKKIDSIDDGLELREK